MHSTRTVAKPLRIIPTMPLRKMIGMKTTIVVIAEAIIEEPTSSEPRIMASSGVIPSRPRCRDICSSMTVEASTTIPSDTTKLAVVMRLMVWPKSFMDMNVNRNDSGIEAPMTSVALPLFRKSNMTITAMTIPVIPELRTLERDSRMLLESSEKIWYVRAPSVSSFRLSSTFFISELIRTVLPPARFVTDTIIRSLPSLMA